MNAKKARQRRAEERARQEARVDEHLRRGRLIKLAAVAVIAVAVVAALIIIASGGEQPEKLTPAQQQSMLAGIPQRGDVLGREDAPVTLTEFADLQCPFCAKYANEVLPTIIKNYVRPGKVKLRQRVLAFLGPESHTAAVAAYAAAEQNKMFDFTGAFFARQGKENSGYVTDEFIGDLAASIPGFNQPQFAADRGGEAAARMVDEATRDADAAQIKGTPAFTVSVGDGKPALLQVNDLSVSAFKRALDDAIAHSDG